MHIFAIMCALNALSVQMTIAFDCSRVECHTHGWVTQTDEFSSKCVRGAMECEVVIMWVALALCVCDWERQRLLLPFRGKELQSPLPVASTPSYEHMQPQKTPTVSIHVITSCPVRPKWQTLLTTNTLFFFEGHWGHEESASSDRVKDGSC